MRAESPRARRTNSLVCCRLGARRAARTQPSNSRIGVGAASSGLKYSPSDPRNSIQASSYRLGSMHTCLVLRVCRGQIPRLSVQSRDLQILARSRRTSRAPPLTLGFPKLWRRARSARPLQGRAPHRCLHRSARRQAVRASLRAPPARGRCPSLRSGTRPASLAGWGQLAAPTQSQNQIHPRSPTAARQHPTHPAPKTRQAPLKPLPLRSAPLQPSFAPSARYYVQPSARRSAPLQPSFNASHPYYVHPGPS